MTKKITKAKLFLELAQPDKKGFSRIVKITEFVRKYSSLRFGNGADWARSSSSFARTYNVEFIKSDEVGKPTVALKLNGFRGKKDTKTQHIRSDIKKEISKKRCVILGTHRSCDHKTEVDHKDGRKQNELIMNSKTQKIEDFQPLSKPANDAKRQFCKECVRTEKRYDAKKLGYPVSFTKGNIDYDEKIGCEGCFWYDPIAFRKKFVLKEDD